VFLTVPSPRDGQGDVDRQRYGAHLRWSDLKDHQLHERLPLVGSADDGVDRLNYGLPSLGVNRLPVLSFGGKLRLVGWLRHETVPRAAPWLVASGRFAPGRSSDPDLAGLAAALASQSSPDGYDGALPPRKGASLEARGAAERGFREAARRNRKSSTASGGCPGSSLNVPNEKTFVGVRYRQNGK
jgi:hypothetical protein